LELEVLAKLQVPARGHWCTTSGARSSETLCLGFTSKVFVDLACSSHNAMWEKNHALLFRASLEWLTQGTVSRTKEGISPWMLIAGNVYDDVCPFGSSSEKKMKYSRNAALCLSLVVLLIGLAAAQTAATQAATGAFSMRVAVGWKVGE
jgi:hypothetical protein